MYNVYHIHMQTITEMFQQEDRAIRDFSATAGIS